MNPHVSVITLGVRDLNRAKQFCGGGLGVGHAHKGKRVILLVDGLEYGCSPRTGSCCGT